MLANAQRPVRRSSILLIQHGQRPVLRSQARKQGASARSQASKLNTFFSTLKDSLQSGVDANDFEPQALIKELTDTSQLGSRGELYFLGQLLLVFLTIFPVVDLHILLQIEGLGAIVLGLAIIVAGMAVATLAKLCGTISHACACQRRCDVYAARLRAANIQDHACVKAALHGRMSGVNGLHCTAQSRMQACKTC